MNRRPTSPCDNGCFSDRLVVCAMARGGHEPMIDAGLRDLRNLTAMGFAVWPRAFSAQRAVKGTLGLVNLLVVCAGQAIEAGDVIVADGDGFCVVCRTDAVLFTACERI